MHVAVVALRVVHIILGIYWGGTILFIATFLEPSVRSTGPAGGAVLMEMDRRGYFKIMPLVAILTVLAGISLLWIDSGGFQPAWMGSSQGIGFSIGGLAAIAALVIAVTIMRPNGKMLLALSRAAMQLPEGPERTARMSELAPIHERIRRVSLATTALIVIASAAMAVSRYLG